MLKKKTEVPIAEFGADIAAQVTAIQDSVKRLANGPLKIDTIIELITSACRPYGARGNRKKVGTRDVKAVLEGMARLEYTHLK